MVREVLTQTPALKEMATAEIQTAKPMRDSQMQTKVVENEIKV